MFAENGGNGSKCCSHGTDGADRYIDVPCGTVVYNAETGEYICDVAEDGQVVLLLKADAADWETTSSVQPPIRRRALRNPASRCRK